MQKGLVAGSTRLLTAGIILVMTGMPVHAQGPQPPLAALAGLPTWAQLLLLLVPAVSATLAAIGLGLNYLQARRNNAQARAALVADCLDGFTSDEEIQRAFYKVEYSEFTYNEDFHGSDVEREIDKLLRHFANIALAWQAGLLRTKDLEPIRYYLARIVRDPEIERYLTFIRDWSEKQGLGEHPYAVLISLVDHMIPKTMSATPSSDESP
jgi:hypothetical protein